jgi:hypothetical protein
MPLDVDYITAKQAIEELSKFLADQPHGEREQIADEIIEFVNYIRDRYTEDES